MREPHSPILPRFISPYDFADDFGPNDRSYRKLEMDWLTGFNRSGGLKS
jgi:hypothetical protein